MSGVFNSTFSGSQIDQAVENYLRYVEVHNSAGMLLLPGYLEKRVDLASPSINVSQGAVFCLTVSSAATISIDASGLTTGYVSSFILALKMTASASVTFPSTVRWAGDMPTLENGKTYEIVLRSYDDGETWIASSGEGANNA